MDVRIRQSIFSSTIQTNRRNSNGHAGNRIPSIPDFSTINRRINRLDVKIKNDVGGGGENANLSEEENGYIIIAIDSSGIKETNRGQWMNKKLGHAKQKRLLANPCCSKHEDQGNSVHVSNRRACAR